MRSANSPYTAVICHIIIRSDISLVVKNGHCNNKRIFNAFYHHIFIFLLIFEAKFQQRLPVLCGDVSKRFEIKLYEIVASVHFW